jgi:formylglycine-generating enzyme
MACPIKIAAAVIAMMACPFLSAQVSTKFVTVPAGVYTIGKQGHGFNPLRQVRVDSFAIGITEITNQQFDAFVTATGYTTDAEKKQDAMVFMPGLKEFEWHNDTTAYWRYPNGISRGGITNKMDHPVTCISYVDAVAYCSWAGVRLPALEEWEIAARAGTPADYFFGTDYRDIDKYGNIWWGRDHLKADSTDGYMYTAPVGSFAPNPWGLYDVYGNVFELCSGKIKANEKPTLAHARGGSWWCSRHACSFFNSYDIGRVHQRASFSNQGFRVVRDLPGVRHYKD